MNNLLFAVSFLAAWYFGLWPALGVTVLSTAALLTLFGEDIFNTVSFSLIACGVSWFIARNNRTLTDLEARFLRAREAIKIGTWYCDLPFSNITWDKQVREHFFFSPDEPVTMEAFFDRIHPDDREPTRLAVEKAVTTGAPYDIVYRTVNPSSPQNVKYIWAMGQTERNKNGVPFRFDGITIEQTEQHKSLEVVETINEVGQSLSAELDQKKLVQKVTDAARELSRAQFGAFFYNHIDYSGESYTLYTVSGVPVEKFSQFPMPRNTAVFAPTFAGEGIIRSDDITQDPRYGKNAPFSGMPAGHLPVVSYLAVPVRSRTGEVIGALFMGHEEKGVFTEREEKLVAGLASQIAIAMDNARLFERAGAAIRIRDEFLSLSSHELKTPLTSLKMQLQLFSHVLNHDKGPVPEERIRKVVEVSERQLNRLNTLVENLLDVSRIANGKLSLLPEKVELTTLIREIMDRYEPMVGQSQCVLRSHLPTELSASVDRLRFEQILVNLVGNALKYAPGSEIDVRLEERAQEIELCVRDTGPGIREEDRERIFQRFEMGSSRQGTGLGLGLYIVNQIVEAHGGKIELKSEPGKGSEFVVRIPREMEAPTYS